MSGSSNFLQFNPTPSSPATMSDADYAASSIRTGGFVSGVARSDFFNKLEYQNTTFIAAFAAWLAALGATASDGDVSVLQSVFANYISNEATTSLASASTVNIGAAGVGNITITGTTSITTFDTIQAGIVRKLTFAASLTLTYNGTSLSLPGGHDIITQAGDVAIMQSLGSGNWQCISYQPSYVTPGLKIPYNGWCRFVLNGAEVTPVYASTSSVTLAGDFTGTLQKGYGVQFTQHGVIKYFYITAAPTYSAPNTTVSGLIGNDASGNIVTVEDTGTYPITNAYWTPNPQAAFGFPGIFNYTITPTGFSGSPTVSGKFTLMCGLCTVFANISGTSNATTFTFNLPVTPAIPINPILRAEDNGSYGGGLLTANASNTTATMYKDTTAAAFTNSGTKGLCYANFSFPY